MELFSKMEIMVMASVLGIVVLLIMFLTILDIFDEKRRKKNEKLFQTKKHEETKVEVFEKESPRQELKVSPKVEVEEIEILDFDEPVIEMKEEIHNDVVLIEEVEEVIYQDIKNDSSNILVIEDDKERAKEELVKLEEELKKEEDFSNTITNFELEQEENAIISYDELIKVSDRLYDQNEIVQYDDGDEPITIDEVIKRFSSSEMVFENTANLDKLNREIGNNDQNLVRAYENE